MPESVEALLEQKMMECRQLRAMLQESNLAVTLMAAHLGDHRGVIRIPAAARKAAAKIETVDLAWSGKERWPEVGSLRITAKQRKD